MQAIYYFTLRGECPFLFTALMSFSYEFEDGTPFNNNFPFNTNLNDLESRDCAVVLWNDDIVQTEQCGHGSYFVCQGMSAN